MDRQLVAQTTLCNTIYSDSQHLVLVTDGQTVAQTTLHVSTGDSQHLVLVTDGQTVAQTTGD